MGASVGKTVSFNGHEFSILKSIGEGGFADIFLVRSEQDRRLRALKRMAVQQDDEEKNKVAKWEFQLNVRKQEDAGRGKDVRMAAMSSRVELLTAISFRLRLLPNSFSPPATVYEAPSHRVL